jgi:hypothetical protein
MLSIVDLSSRLQELLTVERAQLMTFLEHLAEFETRKGYLELGYSSLFAFCTEALGLSRSQSYRRSTAVKLMLRFPLVSEYLRDGRLTPRTLCHLRDLLGENDPREILDRAAGRTEEEIARLAAEASSRRELPSVLRLAVGPEFLIALEQVRSELSHVVPSGNVEAVLLECMRQTLKHKARRRRGGDSPRKAAAAPPSAPRGRTIPAPVRRQVALRDQNRCTFIGSTGKRCDSTWQLEFHHRHPFARGGPTTVENLTLYCRHHNQFAAERAGLIPPPSGRENAPRPPWRW